MFFRLASTETNKGQTKNKSPYDLRCSFRPNQGAESEPQTRKLAQQSAIKQNDNQSSIKRQ